MKKITDEDILYIKEAMKQRQTRLAIQRLNELEEIKVKQIKQKKGKTNLVPDAIEGTGTMEV